MHCPAAGGELVCNAPDDGPEMVWVDQFGQAGGAALSWGQYLATDPAGNVSLCGTLHEDADFGGGLLAGSAVGSVVLASFEADGTPRWSDSFGDAGRQNCNAHAVGGQGDLNVAGFMYQSTVDFGGGELRDTGSPGYGDALLAQLTSAGAHVFSRTLGNPFVDDATAVAVDGDRNVYVAGNSDGSSDFGCGAIAHGAYHRGLWWTRFEPTQDAPRIRCDRTVKYGDADHSAQSRMAVSPAGHVHLLGYFAQGALSDGNTTLSSASPVYYLASYGQDGSRRWWRLLGPGAAHSLALGLGNEDVYVAVSSAGGIRFAPEPAPLHEAVADDDVFLARLGGDGGYRWSRHFDALGDQRVRSLAVVPGDGVYIAGSFQGVVDFGGGALSSRDLDEEEDDVFVAKFDLDGNHRWSAKLGGAGDQELGSLAVDGEGGVYLAGAFDGTLDVLGTPMQSVSDGDVFLVKLCGTDPP